MFSHVFPFTKSKPVIGTNMHRSIVITLDCFAVLRQSLILTVLKRMRVSIKYVQHIFYPKFTL